MAPPVEPSYVPNRFFVNEKEFGVVADAPLRTGVPRDELPELIAALLQHRAAIVVRELLASDPMTQAELGATRGRPPSSMSAYLAGARPASLVEMCNWAVQLNDPSVIAPFDDLYLIARAATAG